MDDDRAIVIIEFRSGLITAGEIGERVGLLKCRQDRDRQRMRFCKCARRYPDEEIRLRRTVRWQLRQLAQSRTLLEQVRGVSFACPIWNLWMS